MGRQTSKGIRLRKIQNLTTLDSPLTRVELRPGVGQEREETPLLPRGERGAVMVEFVLVAGLLFLLTFAILDLGLLLNARLVVASAARDGARRAAVEGGATATAVQRIEQQLRLGNIDPARAVVEIKPRRAAYGSTIRVTVSYEYPLITPVVRTVVGSSVRLESQVVTRSEKVQ